MLTNEEDFTELYKVLINDEEQYSFWPIFRKDIPLGWRETGFKGTKDECCTYVRRVWIDMRPLSVRKQASAIEK